MKSNRHAGQYKLRGKKHLGLPCKCCEVFNCKAELREKEDKKGMHLAKRTFG